MRNHIRSVLGLTALLIAVGCGGAQFPSATQASPTGEPIQAVGMLPQDVEQLVCTAVALAPVVETVSLFVPDAGAFTPGASSRLPGSVQQQMATSDAMSRARANGESVQRAIQLAETARASGRGEVWSGDSQRPAGPPAEQVPLLKEYATLWALLLTEPEPDSETQARVKEIDALRPDITDAYVKILAYASGEVDFGCAEAGS